MVVFLSHPDTPMLYSYPYGYAEGFKTEAECIAQGNKEGAIYLSHPAKGDTKGFRMKCIQDEELEKVIEHIKLNERKAST